MNACKVPDMYKDMEYKLVTEDSKTRVYLSLVRSEEDNEKIQSHRNKRKYLRRAIIAGFIIVEAAITIGAGLAVNDWIQGVVEAQRGYSAMGSEIFIGALVSGLVAVIAESIIGGVATLEKELK